MQIANLLFFGTNCATPRYVFYPSMFGSASTLVPKNKESLILMFFEDPRKYANCKFAIFRDQLRHTPICILSFNVRVCKYASPEKQRISDSYVFRGSTKICKLQICYFSGPTAPHPENFRKNSQLFGYCKKLIQLLC